MDSAKAAVSDFLSKDGKHDTTVHETVNPAVQNEHVSKTQHEEARTAIDREVHQDHYHTSIQPIQHQEVLPEQHSHNLAAVKHREVKHGNDEHVRQRLEAERAQFKNTKEVGETQHSASVSPTVAGEHVHHHVHEVIQPVIQKETIQPTVVHTTIPVHEVHNNEAKFEDKTALPTMTMDEFKHSGNALHGAQRRRDSFEGKPEGLGALINPTNKLGTIGGKGAEGTTSMTGDLDPKVGPNRGSVPAKNAQDHVTKRNDGVAARETIDANVPQQQHSAATNSSAPRTSTTISSTPARSPSSSTTANGSSSTVPATASHSSTNSGLGKTADVKKQDTGKHGVLEKIKSALH